MNAKRTNKNSWTKEDQTLLLEVILTSLRNGDTQEEGFKTAAKKIGKTPAACSFHFFNYLKKDHIEEINAAKFQKKKNKALKINKKENEVEQSKLVQNVVQKQEIIPMNENVSLVGLQDAFSLIQKVIKEYEDKMEKLTIENAALRNENEQFKKVFELANSQLSKYKS